MNQKRQDKIALSLIRFVEQICDFNEFEEFTNFDINFNDLQKLDEILRIKLELNKLMES